MWDDTNGDGLQDGGEPGIDGVSVNLFLDDGGSPGVLDLGDTSVDTTTTAGGGFYLFTGVTPDTYLIEFDPSGVPGTWLFTEMHVGGDDTIDSDAKVATGVTDDFDYDGGFDDTRDAGLYQEATLGDRFWEDANGNGIQDGGETAASGPVKLLNSSMVEIDSTTATSFGYSFTGLAPGTYYVQFPTLCCLQAYTVQDAGGDDTVDSDVDATGKTSAIVLSSGEVDVDSADAGLFNLVTLSDFVWDDLDLDGEQDALEPGIDGVTLNLLSGGGVVDTEATAGGGLYAFAGVAPGTYEIEIVVPGGKALTLKDATTDDKDSDADQSTAKTDPFAVVSGVNQDTWDFGLVPLIDPPMTGLLWERWTGIPGAFVPNLTSHPDYPASPDITTMHMGDFHIPLGGLNIGDRVRGFVIPSVTDTYTFWVASDVRAEVFLSSDADPANLINGGSPIALVPFWTNTFHWNKYLEQMSAPVALEAGKAYYIEGLHKNNHLGNGNFSVGWSRAGDPNIFVIPQANLWIWKGIGDIHIEKVVPGGTGFGFTHSIPDGVGGFSLDDGASKSFTVPAGVTFTVTEDDPGPEWQLDSLLCDDPAGSGSVPARTATITLADGDAVTCTYTNIPTFGSIHGFKFEDAVGDGEPYVGSLDAFVANSLQPNVAWFNDGAGGFTASAGLGSADSFGVALGDVDGDGDLDAYVTNFNEPNVVWVNQGGVQAGTEGVFVAGPGLGSAFSFGVALGDVDGDGDLDAYVANLVVANVVWVNQGGVQAGTEGVFVAGPGLGSADSVGVALGDVDGDGDLDAYVANLGAPNVVWVNQGGVQAGTEGVFVAGPGLGFLDLSSGVALGDVDGDGDLDAYVAIDGDPNVVWVNQGGVQAGTEGVFVAGAGLGSADSFGVALGDLDGIPNGPLKPPLAGVEFKLTGTTTGGDPVGPIMQSTNAAGEFWFEDLAPGTYTVTETVPAGYVSTTGASAMITIGPGEEAVALPGQAMLDPGQFETVNPDLFFGNALSGSIHGYKFDDAVGDGEAYVGSLDAFVANSLQPNVAWFNDGAGGFTAGAGLGSANGRGVALGDVDGDGDLDAYVANSGANVVWVNQGGVQARTEGVFVAGPGLGSANSRGVALGDVDGDGDLDAYVANSAANVVWVNQGGVQAGTEGVFVAGPGLGSASSFWVALGDVDGDGDLDAYVANFGAANVVWVNQGGVQAGTEGVFVAGPGLGSANGRGVALGDVDGDGDLDAYVANVGANVVWVNQGGVQAGTEGVFVAGPGLGSAFSFGVALGDVDGDGDLDAYVANVGANVVWVNQGGVQAGTEGVFVAGPGLGSAFSFGVALGDVDGDGDLDAYVANFGVANVVWVNQGGVQAGTEGVFVAGPGLGSAFSFGVALGDVDGDGDLDAYVANFGVANVVWVNQGGVQAGTEGVFVAGPGLGSAFSFGVALGDVDGDGDLDAYVANQGANVVWVNQGGVQAGTEGVFVAGLGLGSANSRGVALGDVDGDGDLDAYVANNGAANVVWVNQGGVQAGTEGVFVAGAGLGSALSLGVALGDVDGDGDLDAYVANFGAANVVWVNQGGVQAGTEGVFVAGPGLGSAAGVGVALGDLDGIPNGPLKPPMAGVEFTLTGTTTGGDPVGPLIETTNAAGEFWFEDLPPGTYTVTETVPAGYASTTGASVMITIGPGEEAVAFAGQAMLDPGQFETVNEDLFFGNQAIAVRVSSTPGGDAGDKISSLPTDGALAWSPDGSRVVFESTASDLVAGSDPNGPLTDVFVFDVATGTVTRVSSTPGGDAGDDVSSLPPAGAQAWSPDGTRVLFESDASDLVAGSDTNAATDVFVFEVATGTVTRVSSITPGGGASTLLLGGAEGWSPDGTRVLFRSLASDLGAGSDTNGAEDVFVFEVATGAVTRVSSITPGGDAGDSVSFLPTDTTEAWSPDGTRVIFTSLATDLGAGSDTNSAGDVFVFEVATGVVTRMSSTPGGDASDLPSTLVTDGAQAWSPDSTSVVFESFSTDLTTGSDTNGGKDLFVFEVATGTVSRVSSTPGGDATSTSFLPSLPLDGTEAWSPDSTRVLFTSKAFDLGGGVDTNADTDVFMFEVATGTVTRVSSTPGGDAGGTFPFSSDLPPGGAEAWSPDSTMVLFTSSAPDLVSGADTNGPDVFVFEVATGTVTRLSSTPGGDAGDNLSSLPFNGSEAWSPDSARVLFRSLASDLVAGSDTNAVTDVFVFEVATGAVSRVSSTPGGDAGDDGSGLPTGGTEAWSPDSARVLFTSSASDLVAGSDTNAGADVFVFEVATGAVSRVSSTPGGDAGDSFSSLFAGPEAWSPDSSSVLFYGSSSDLGTGSDTNGALDLFVFEVATGAVSRVTSTPGGDAGDAGLVLPGTEVWSADSSKVLFESNASDLVAGSDTNAQSDVFYRTIG